MRPVVPAFEIEQTCDAGALRVALIGELDLSGSEEVGDVLRAMIGAGPAVRLDLSGLQFIDSMGLRTLIHTAQVADREGWQLEIEREVAPQVQRLIDLLGVESLLWAWRDASDRPDHGAERWCQADRPPRQLGTDHPAAA